MGNDWPTISKVIISAVPALMISLGVLLVLIDWPWRGEAIRLGTWIVLGGAVLFIFEIIVIYFSRLIMTALIYVHRDRFKHSSMALSLHKFSDIL